MYEHDDPDFWNKHKHCDDFINDESQPQCLRAFLDYHRVPASEQYRRQTQPDFKEPVLFAIRKETGEQVRVTMASRFGDVGITRHLKNMRGYEHRVLVEDLTDFTDDLTQPQKE